VSSQKIAEEYFKLKPYFNDSFPNFPSVDTMSPDYYVEFNCLSEGGRGIANFVRMYVASYIAALYISLLL
jgi:hypothetical protein